MKPRHRLSEFEVKEVSLVDEGANNRKFLMLKRKGGTMPNLLEKIEKLEIDGGKFEEIVKKHGLSDDDKELFGAFMKIHKSLESDNVRKAFNEFLDIKEPVKEPVKKELSPEAKEAIEKEKTEKEAVLKENDRLGKENKELKEKELKIKYDERVKEFKKLPIQKEKFGGILRSIDEKLSKDESEELNRILKTTDAVLEKSNALFEEVGTGKSGGGDLTLEKYEVMAQELAQKEKISLAKAKIKLYKEFPEYYKLESKKGDK